MGFRTAFDFKDASIKGDPKWARTSPRFAAYAPPVVICLAVLSIVEVVLGVVWITGIQSLANGFDDLTFAQVIQPLIVPALSFFNTIPSLHLHVLARSNNPLMALSFSSILSAVFFASAVVFLPPCAGGQPDPDTLAAYVPSYQKTECPPGSNRAIWAAIISLQFVSAVLYAVHAAMANVVRRRVRSGERDRQQGNMGTRLAKLMEVTEEEKQKREEEARKRWRDIAGDL